MLKQQVARRKEVEEALRQERATLQRSQSLLTQSQQLARLGSWEWDVLSDKLSWSDELYRIFGVEPGLFDGTYETFLARVHPDDRGSVHTALQNARYAKRPFTLYEHILQPDGKVRTLYGIGKPVLDEAGEVVKVIGTYQDLTEQKEVEAKLALQARKLAALNKMGQTVTITSDVDVVFQRVLTALRPLLGAEGVFILLLEGDELVFAATEDVGESRLQGLRIPATAGVPGEVIRKGKSIWISGNEIPRRISRRFKEVYGQSLQALMAVPMRIQDEWVGVLEAVHSQPDAFDADDLQLLEAAASWVATAIQNARLFAQIQASRQRLGRLARKVVTAQEEERLRVSRELHDESGQAMIALKLNLESILASLPKGTETSRRQLAEAISLTDQTMEQIRLVAHNLRPQVLESLGLNSALEGLCNDFSMRTQLSVRYEGVDLPALSDPVVISFYRFLQETLTNVAKHACASQVEVVLSQNEDAICLSVADNGKGISLGLPNNPSEKSIGLGLTGLQERFELLGGWVAIETGSVEGTRVAAYVPVET